jgi:hypothetical protein
LSRASQLIRGVGQPVHEETAGRAGMTTHAAESAIDRINWSSLRLQSGTAEHIGPVLRELLAAATPDAADLAYWKLENAVVVQGTVYEAAEATVSILMQALATERPAHVRIAILKLLYEVVAGCPPTPDQEELIHRCRARCREGVWVLVRELVTGYHDAALDVLAVLSGAAKGTTARPTSVSVTSRELQCRPTSGCS